MEAGAHALADLYFRAFVRGLQPTWLCPPSPSLHHDAPQWPLSLDFCDQGCSPLPVPRRHEENTCSDEWPLRSNPELQAVRVAGVT